MDDIYQELKDKTLKHYNSFPSARNPWYQRSWNCQETRKHVLGLVEDLQHEILESGSIFYPSKRARLNVYFVPGYGLRLIDEPFYSELRQQHNQLRFNKFIFVLKTMKDCIESGRRLNKRDLYYQNVNNFNLQPDLDEIVCQISSIFGIPRVMLGISSTSKGLVAGNLKFVDEDNVLVDCTLSEGGIPIPQDSALLKRIEMGAKIILVVEKDTVFQRLQQEFADHVISDSFDPLRDILLVTGKGVPDFSTRAFLCFLSDQLKIPILLLTDCDPFGFEIMLTYRFGSQNMAVCGETLALPNLLWLGVHSKDMAKLQIADKDKKVLSEADVKKLKDIYKRDHIRTIPDFLKQLDIIYHQGKKVEIEQVAEVSGFTLTDYIHHKLITLDVM